MFQKCIGVVVVVLGVSVIAAINYGGTVKASETTETIGAYAVNNNTGGLTIYANNSSATDYISEIIDLASPAISQDQAANLTLEVDIDYGVVSSSTEPDSLDSIPPGYNEVYDSGDDGGWNEHQK